MARSKKRSARRGQLRIIGGQWRGRRLSFTPAEGLRPTSDRIRETLFNWLAPYTQGAHCADLFAGSGALGLEALSRGARHCDFVDTSNAALAQVEDHLAALSAADQGRCHRGSAAHFLNDRRQPYDLIFIDPPFDCDLVEPVCSLLAEPGLVSPAAMIYVEMASNEAPPKISSDWQLHREKVSGGVAYRLYQAGA